MATYLYKIVRDKTDTKIQRHKTMHGLSGDVYIITPGNIIESLASHKKLFPDSIATTIEEAASYHAQYLYKLSEQRRLAAQEAAENGSAAQSDTIS